MLTSQNLHEFEVQGYTLIPDVVNDQALSRCKDEIDNWASESRYLKNNYGKLINGRARFELAQGHTRFTPKLQQINNPIEISQTYRDLVLNGKIPELLVPILGYNIKFDHCKINTQYPEQKTSIDFHQAHAIEPQTNHSVVVAIVLLDDMALTNGCLRIVPGSHKTQYSHYQNGRFSGKIDRSILAKLRTPSQPVVAKSGSLCLLDTWVVHGFDVNQSNQPLRLLISEYKSPDTYPLSHHKLPSKFMNTMVLGKDDQKVR